MIEVTLPDGSIMRFPEGTSTDVIEKAIRERFAAQEPERDLAGATSATLSGITNGIPILGPLSQFATDSMMGLGAQMTGGDYGETVQGLKDRREQLANDYPLSSIAGNVAGAGMAFGTLAAPQAGSKALGLIGTNGEKMVNGFMSSNGIGLANDMIKARIR